ncbi:putative redox protein, regulator of disulfide bond formation [Geoglobus ahangari]|uniref:Putative redox protein, regulator of disulfide bond formation n=1 Tax=Geoglobus ahangari TaxID=113653 RepID=A0A0F7IDL0_9EURY|nr:sulfurtransferase TusA family protein [Geoglobus ahangari]AKG90673.1 putative redox protein, regulator of disulfide bond formation [Geoglobus ahangari]
MKVRKSVDCIGMFCPTPLFEARKAVEEVEVGEIVEVLADDPSAKKDIPEWAERAGHEVVDVKEDDGVFIIKIRRGV